jgi:uncharacterized coiled-coil protein SlyX
MRSVLVGGGGDRSVRVWGMGGGVQAECRQLTEAQLTTEQAFQQRDSQLREEMAAVVTRLRCVKTAFLAAPPSRTPPPCAGSTTTLGSPNAEATPTFRHAATVTPRLPTRLTLDRTTAQVVGGGRKAFLALLCILQGALGTLPLP